MPASATFNWDTSSLPSGQYEFIVMARDAASPGISSSSAATWDAYTTLTYQVTTPGTVTPCTAVNGSAAPPSPQTVGTQVAITGAAAGGVVCTRPRYEFWILTPGAGMYTLVQAYSATATFNWDTTGFATGSYNFIIFARDATSTGTSSSSADTYDSFTSVPYDLTANANACTSVADTTSPGTSAPPGTPVLITGQAFGCPDPLYDFWVLAPGAGSYTEVQPYSTTNSYNWNTTGAAPGVYTWIIFARDLSSVGTQGNSSARWDAYAQFTYTLT